MLLLLKVPGRAVMDVMGWAQVTMTKRYQHITTKLTTMIADQVGGCTGRPMIRKTGMTTVHPEHSCPREGTDRDGN